MDRIIDEIIILALCLALLAVSSSALAVAGLLMAVVVVCVCEIVPVEAVRYICLVGYLVCAIFFEELFLPLPLVIYQCVAQRSGFMRFVWIAVPVVAYVLNGPYPAVFVMLLCAVSAVLSVRSARNMAERKYMRCIRDGLREQLNKAEVEAEVKAEGEAARADVGSDVGASDVESCVNTGRNAVAPSMLQGLTDREQTIAGLIAEGFDNKGIASELYLSEGTVRNHISCILQKTHLKNRTQIAIMYLTELRS